MNKLPKILWAFGILVFLIVGMGGEILAKTWSFDGESITGYSTVMVDGNYVYAHSFHYVENDVRLDSSITTYLTIDGWDYGDTSSTCNDQFYCESESAPFTVEANTPYEAHGIHSFTSGDGSTAKWYTQDEAEF